MGQIKILYITTFLIFCISCGETVRVPYDNSKKLAQIDEDLKKAKDKTKKAEDGLKEAKRQLKDAEDQEASASGAAKDKIREKIDEFKKAINKYNETLKITSISTIITMLDIIDQSGIDKRKKAYHSLTKHEYDGDILKNYFDGGPKPTTKDLSPLEQEELNKINNDIANVWKALQ